MKWYSRILISLFLLIMGYLLGVFFPLCLRPNIAEAPITKGEYINVFINIVVAIASFLAVIVALFKESILSLLNHPNLAIQLLDDGIIENIDREQQYPKTESYVCLLEINNKGNKVAEGTEIVVEEVQYSKRSKNDLQPIRGYRGKKKLFWDSVAVELPTFIPKEIELFNIVCPNNYGTPDVPTTDNIEKLRIKFNGLDLNLNQTEKGFWQIKYYIRYKGGKSVRFSLLVEWDGTWKSRKMEMKDVLKVKLKEYE